MTAEPRLEGAFAFLERAKLNEKQEAMTDETVVALLLDFEDQTDSRYGLFFCTDNELLSVLTFGSLDERINQTISVFGQWLSNALKRQASMEFGRVRREMIHHGHQLTLWEAERPVITLHNIEENRLLFHVECRSQQKQDAMFDAFPVQEMINAVNAAKSFVEEPKIMSILQDFRRQAIAGGIKDWVKQA